MTINSTLIIGATLLLNLSIIGWTAGADLVLAWEAPIAQTDQTAIANLRGYRVYFGTASGSYNHFVDVPNVLTTAVTNLQAGIRYYFAVAAYTDYDVEGILSDEVAWEALELTGSTNFSVSIAASPLEGPKHFTITWPAKAGRAYFIEISRDLIRWQPASSGQSACEQSTQNAVSDGVLTFCDIESFSDEQRYYRIKTNA